jgi:hypothetical protein
MEDKPNYSVPQHLTGINFKLKRTVKGDEKTKDDKAHEAVLFDIEVE